MPGQNWPVDISAGFGKDMPRRRFSDRRKIRDKQLGRSLCQKPAHRAGCMLRTMPRDGLYLFARAEFYLRGLSPDNIAVDIAAVSVATDMPAVAMPDIYAKSGVIVKVMKNGARRHIGSKHHYA